MTETVAGPGLFDLLRVAGALAVVLALAIGFGVVVRRGGLGAVRRGSLRVEERLSVARGVQLAVVRCGARRLLVGVSDKTVNLVTELDEGETPDTASERASSETDLEPDASLSGFAGRLAAALHSRGVAGRSA